MADEPNNNEQFPLWRGIAGAIGVVLVTLIIWFGSSAAQSREDIAVIREQISQIRGDVTDMKRVIDQMRFPPQRGVGP
jgi:hypothetical protein